MIYIGGDKHGYQVIEIAKEWLEKKNLEYKNLGVPSDKEDMKLEDLLPKIANKVKENDNNLGIISCGTGIGVEVGINKFSGIRACLVDDAEIAKWSRVYDKCNVLCLIGWRINKNKIETILEQWFKSEYDGNKNRLKMIAEFDNWN